MMPHSSQTSAEGADYRVTTLVVILTIVSVIAVLILVPSLLIALLLVASGEGIAKLVAVKGMSACLVFAWIPVALMAGVNNIALGVRSLRQPTGGKLAAMFALSVLILAGFPALWYQWS